MMFNCMYVASLISIVLSYILSFTWHFCLIFVSNTLPVTSSEIWAKPTLFWTWISIASVQLLRHALPSPSMYCVWQNVNPFGFFWDHIHPPYIVRENSSYSPLLKLSSKYYIWISLLFFCIPFLMSLSS